MDDRTYNRLFGETRREMFNRHNGILMGRCPKCGAGFTSKRNQQGHTCCIITTEGKEDGNV